MHDNFSPDFLDLQDVIDLQAMQIEMFGGAPGIRDVALVASAVNAPQASFGGQFMCKDIYEMAAKYLYHLNKNHGFIDGNKRIGAHAALVFLELNDEVVSLADEDIVDISMGVANNLLSYDNVVEILISAKEVA